MKIFIFGLGYSSLHFVRHHSRSYTAISGTVRTQEKRDSLAREGISAFLFSDSGSEISKALEKCNAIIVSVGPGLDGDPVLNNFAAAMNSMPALQSIIYLSTIGVYGDHDGAWIDEATPVNPGSERSKARVAAENAWRAFAESRKCDLHILRLAGIYGPGRNTLENLKSGKAKRIIKPGQVFNRIHVEDIARTISACLARPVCKETCIWNVCDNEPCPPQDVVTYAADLAGVPPPPEIQFSTADMTPMARSFYGENKRVSNRALREDLGVELAYPDYRTGMQALLNAASQDGEPADS